MGRGVEASWGVDEAGADGDIGCSGVERTRTADAAMGRGREGGRRGEVSTRGMGGFVFEIKGHAPPRHFPTVTRPLPSPHFPTTTVILPLSSSSSKHRARRHLHRRARFPPCHRHPQRQPRRITRSLSSPPRIATPPSSPCPTLRQRNIPCRPFLSSPDPIHCFRAKVLVSNLPNPPKHSIIPFPLDVPPPRPPPMIVAPPTAVVVVCHVLGILVLGMLRSGHREEAHLVMSSYQSVSP